MEAPNGRLYDAVARAGVGMREIRLAGQVILEADAPRARASGPRDAFKASIRFIEGEANVRVGPGWINLVVPTGIRVDNPLSGEPQYVVIEVTTDGRQLTSASIGLQVDAPDPPACVLGAPPLAFKVPIAYVGTSAAPFVSQITFRNLVAQRALCHQTDRDPIPAGASPWINWFTWSVAEAIQPQVVEM